MPRRWWRCCCCCCAREESDIPGSTKPRSLTDQDYLLPGGEWDPSLSERSSVRSAGTHSKKKYLKAKELSTSSSTERDGLYKPPAIVPSQVLPSYEDFKLLRTVGRGAFGKVLLCVHESTRILYAMKVVPKAKISTQKQVTQILTECSILKKIRHPFCVTLQYAFQSEDYLFYIFEFAAGGMLFHHLRQAGKFQEPRARFYFGEIILAIDYLHSLGVIFRDLKPENCMLSEQGHIILTDFGSAKRLELSQKTNTIAGTPQYIAPEVLRGDPYSFSADWWSCGILLYEMLTGRTPFHSADRVELYKLVLRGDFDVPFATVSPRAKNLLYRLINRDPDFRIGCGSSDGTTRPVSEIKEHPFFSRAPLDPDEESQYSVEETERTRHKEAYRRASQRSGSIIGAAGSVLRSISDQTKRFSMRTPLLGTPCEWTWEQLEAREATPPFHPKLTSPTDLRHFDPTLTSLPPTISDLITTDRDLHLEGFTYVAPPATDERQVPKGEIPSKREAHTSSVASSNGQVSVNVSDIETTTDVSTQVVSVEINDF